VEQLLALYDPEVHGSLAYLYGQDPAVVSLSFALYDLWFLGYPDRALKRAKEALALAIELDHPFTLLFAAELGARLHRWRRDVPAVQELAEILRTLATEHGVELAGVGLGIHRAWMLSQQGQHEEGIAQLTAALAAWEAIDMANHLPEWLAMLAEMQGQAGRPQEGLSTLDEALDIVNSTDERYYEAELYRLRGMLLMTPEVGDEAGAEASFRRAVEAARRHSARMSELRATMGLCQLWLTQERADKREEAREMLAEIYG